MMPVPTIAIFDIGKTNKKFFLLNEQYKIVLESSVQIPEIKDEDGFPCDDVKELSQWIKRSIEEIFRLPGFDVKGINFSAYGAGFVHINSNGEVITPLYNYLKPYPADIKKKFYDTYGGETALSIKTASPVLGNLNSGMQLYRLKHEKKKLFDQIAFSLHLPQYISYLVTGKTYSEITSIGCHTGLWNFSARMYHDWVYAEEIDEKFPPVLRSNAAIDVAIQGKKIKAGIGLHDSSAALIPYLACFSEPFILISTGTWCISLNLFNDDALTAGELQQDCLCYLDYHGRPVKASRLFAGNEHEQQIKRLATHFKLPEDYYKKITFIPALLEKISKQNKRSVAEISLQSSAFVKRDLADFLSYEEAYHQLIFDIMQQQKISTSLVLSSKKVPRILVDGGFAKNPVYMHMLAAAFPAIEVYAASVSQATAIGAALAIHAEWNVQPVQGDMVELTRFR